MNQSYIMPGNRPQRSLADELDQSGDTTSLSDDSSSDSEKRNVQADQRRVPRKLSRSNATVAPLAAFARKEAERVFRRILRNKAKNERRRSRIKERSQVLEKGDAAPGSSKKNSLIHGASNVDQWPNPPPGMEYGYTSRHAEGSGPVNVIIGALSQKVENSRDSLGQHQTIDQGAVCTLLLNKKPMVRLLFVPLAILAFSFALELFEPSYCDQYGAFGWGGPCADNYYTRLRMRVFLTWTSWMGAPEILT